MSEQSRSISILNRMRRLSQLAMLAVLGQWSFYSIFRCPFPVPFVSCQGCPVITCWGRITGLFWGFWGLLFVSVFLFGRSFCGWACPVGLINQMTAKVSLLKMRRAGFFIKTASAGLFVGLLIALIIWLGYDNPRLIIPIRIGEFWESIRLSFTYASDAWLLRTFFVLALLAGGFLLSNLWCRFACPTGGLLEILKRFSWFRIFKTGACNDCDACRTVCDMGTRPDEINCINCGDCLQSCPVDAIQVGRKQGAK